MRPFVADPEDLTDELVDDAGRSTPAAAARTLSISRREIARGRLVRQAKIIKMPMLVVSGEADQIVDPHSVSAWAGSVERAEICLIDECGHVPMLERPAEFAAQILAFLTGDARYLDQMEPPIPTDEEEDLTDDTLPQVVSEEEVQASGPEGEADDTADLTSEYPVQGSPPETNGPPRVHRKRGGSYEDGEEDGPLPAPEPPEHRFRDRDRPATSADDPIPELPPDLFDWPEPRPRRARRPKEDPPTGNDEE